MELAVFLISLAVKDIGASRKFYEKFGFRTVGGNASFIALDSDGNPILHDQHV
jgi:predicted lactoylglutathione lyase